MQARDLPPAFRLRGLQPLPRTPAFSGSSLPLPPLELAGASGGSGISDGIIEIEGFEKSELKDNPNSREIKLMIIYVVLEGG